MRPVIACLSRNGLARDGVSLTGSTDTPITRTSCPRSSSAPRMLCTCAGQMSRQVEDTNATTTGRPRSEAPVTSLPSWFVSVKPGRCVPGGRTAPCHPPAGASSWALASHTPSTPAGAQKTSVVSASTTRVGTHRRLRRAPRRSRLGQPTADRVADELDAIAHAELAQQVGPVRLDGLLRQVQDLADLAVGVRLGDQLEDLLLARRQRLDRPGAVVRHPVAHEGALRGVGQERLPPPRSAGGGGAG